jgi:HSP20 family molecular chaperone IbpA
MSDFQRDFDQLFDDLLIGPWRAPATENEPAMITDRDDAYEVRVCTGPFKPSELELLVTEKLLTVRARHADTSWERLVSFEDPVQTEKVAARWAKRVLTIILPKKTRRPRAEKK